MNSNYMESAFFKELWSCYCGCFRYSLATLDTFANSKDASSPILKVLVAALLHRSRESVLPSHRTLSLWLSQQKNVGKN